MVEISNLVAALVGAVGLVILAVGRVPIPGRSAVTGVVARLAGAVLLLPWPAAQGLALMAKAAREMDGNPPDKPETVQLITAFVQLVLLFAASLTSFVLVMVTAMTSRRSQREVEDRIIPRRTDRG